MPDEATQSGNVELERELFAHRLSVRRLLIEKLLLALVFVAIGYFISRSLETYRSALAAELERSRAEQAEVVRATEAARADAAAAQQREFERELAALQSAQDRQLELLRQDLSRESETLRMLLETQGQLALRRVAAYDRLWRAYGSLRRHVSDTPASGSRIPLASPHDSLLLLRAGEFGEVLASERLFIDSESGSVFDRVIASLADVASSEVGDAMLFDAEYAMTQVEDGYRRRMDSVFAVVPRRP